MIGRVSESGHPQEGVWLTFSSPQTLASDPGGVTAGRRENLAVVTTPAEVRATLFTAALMTLDLSVYLLHATLTKLNICLKVPSNITVLILSLYYRKDINL